MAGPTRPSETRAHDHSIDYRLEPRARIGIRPSIRSRWLSCDRHLPGSGERHQAARRGRSRSRARSRLHRLDAANQESIKELAKQMKGRPIDFLVSNAAISGNKTGAAHELDEKTWIDVFRANTMGPTFLAGEFAECVAASERRVMAFISTRQAIIKDNVRGRYYMYRSSKTALNACVKNLAIDYGPRGVACMAFHPGFVRTDMGGPERRDRCADQRHRIDEVAAGGTTRRTTASSSNIPGSISTGDRSFLRSTRSTAGRPSLSMLVAAATGRSHCRSACAPAYGYAVASAPD